MAYRQRNIPVTSKEESESQTDVRLLENYLLDIRNQEEQRRTESTTIKLSHVYGSSGLLRPFGDHHLLKELSTGLQELKDLPYDQKVFGKRLALLEDQIGGLLKRDFLIHSVSEGSQAWSSYYSTLNQKEKEIIRLDRERIYSNLKVTKLSQKIQALEEQVHQLRVSLVHSQQAIEENKIYSQFYEKIKQIINTSQKKGADIEKVYQEQMLPIYTEFSFNLNALTRFISKEVTINVRPLALSLAKELDRVLREPNFNEDRFSENVLSFLNNFRAVKGVEYLQTQFDLAQRTETAQNNYRNLVSLFNHQISQSIANNPSLKGLETLDLLSRRLEDERIDLVNINGWVNLTMTDLRVREVNRQDKKLRQLLGSLAGQFKRVYTKFPELQKHCSSTFLQILESDLLVELIEGGSIQRLKEIIVHEVDTVRVQNVYRYENSQEAKLILHLRVLIKSLLDELFKIKERLGIELDLDEAILALLKQQCIDGINIEEVIACFRPPARFIEVPIVVQNKVYESTHYEKGVPINRSNPVVITEEKLQVVPIKQEVPVYIENSVDHVIVNQVPVEITAEKLIEATVTKQVVVDRIVQEIKEVPTIREKVVPAYEREEVVREIQVDRVVKDIQTKEIEKIVQVKVQQILEVEKIIQKAVVANQYKEIIRDVQVRVPQVITKTQILEVQKKIPYIIEKEIPVEIRSQIPIEIKVPELQFIDIVEYRDKPIVKTNTIEKPVYVELKVEKQIIKEIPKEIFIDRSHFIKGDRQEVIREVQVFVDKPIIQEVLRTKEIQVEKIVPLYVTEQVPVIERIPEPYFSQKVKEVEVENVKIVTAKQEVVKPVQIDKPVPIIVEREIVKVQPQFIDRIIEKIVEVPRVVEVQKIVEKIVVVPRIVEKIVQVPKIIEKIVVCKEIQLQIVEIQVPQLIIQQVQVPIEIPVEKVIIVKQKDIEQVEVPRIVETRVVEEKIVEVQVQRRVPVEVIKEVPVQTYRDRIEYQKVEIHQTKVEAIEVQVPVIVQEKVPFIVEKEVITHQIIQEPIYQKIIYEKEKPIVTQEQKLIIKEAIIEKPIIVREAVDVPGPETIIRLNDPVEVEIIKEKLVKQPHYVQIIKEVVVEQQKIIPVIHEKIVSVPINELVTTPELIEVPKIVNLVHYKEIPVEVPVREERIESRIVQDTITVEKTVQVPFNVQVTREKIKEIVNEVKCIVNKQTVKEIKQEVEILLPTQKQIVEVPGESIIKELRSEIKTVDLQDKFYEKMVEKIIVLPQVVEIVKNIHHIAEVNQLGVAVDVDVNVHAEKFVGVSTELRKSLVQLLGTFRSNVGRQPDLKNLIVIIEKYLKFIDDWIAFPKLVEIQKEVIKEVQIERPIIVPTHHKERQSTLCYILEKLLNELKRIKESHKISLNLEEDIHRIFFSERRGEEDLDKKFSELQQQLKAKYRSFGSWSQSHPFLVSSFLNDHLALQSLVDQANRAQLAQSSEIDNLRHQLEATKSKYNHLLCYNRKMLDDNNSLIRTLQKYRSSIESQEYTSNIQTHREFYQEIISGKLPVFLSSIERFTKFTDSEIVGQISEESTVHKEAYISELVGKLNKYQAEHQSIMNKSRRLQTEITKYTDEINVKNSIIKRLQTDFETKLSRAREELGKSPDVNRDLLEENKKLVEKSRALEKEYNAEKINADKARRELERALESQKRDLNREIERKEREVKDSVEQSKKQFERELKKVTTELERVRKTKERLDEELIEIKRKHTEEIRTIREQQMSGATDKHNQLLNENVQLRKRSDRLEAQYEKLKKAAVENNAINERQTQKLKVEIERLQEERRSWERKHKEGFLDLPQETQIINKNIELEKKLKIMEADLSKFRSRDESSMSELRDLREKVYSLQTQLEASKREIESINKMKSTTYQSGYKSGIGSQLAVESSIARSPKGAIFKSAEQKGFVSPQSVQSEERIQELGSSSSRFSQESAEERRAIYKSQMSLREFMDIKHMEDKEKDTYTTYVMIKIIEAVEREAENGVYHSYSPNNIYLHNFNVKNLEQLTVKFGAHIINKNNKNDGLYLAPEVLGGSVPTKKSVVFCLGVILDELIHGAPFFKSIEDIQNMHIQFKVRGQKLNPILKNTLFEMMNKEPSKRLEMIEAKRRLSLQKYITSQSRSSVTTHQRVIYSRREE